VRVNRPIRLVVVNTGLVEHDLVVERLPATNVRASGDGGGHGGHGRAGEVAAHAAVGQQAWVAFTPTKEGTYEIICSVAGHKEAGMRSLLVVG
jgi:uncharacterized cupredoxin-like copper-binding protein